MVESPAPIKTSLIGGIKGWTSYVLQQEFPFLKLSKTFWSGLYVVASSGNVSSETSRKYIEES
ncbi:MAG: transposase [Promethearchaeota archaeon]